MMEIFRCKGGVAGRKMRHIMVAVSKDDIIRTRRPCILKSLCVYLNEDHEEHLKEYMNPEAMEQTVMGVYVIQQEGAEPGDDPENTGVLIEGVEVLTGLRSITIACALLFGLIYCLNLSYPLELKCTFEVLQKVIMNLDGQRFSSVPKKQANGVNELETDSWKPDIFPYLCNADFFVFNFESFQK
uniref:Uncharacterized protein n=1 Tax=Paramormyrops kingsleyae TaxID=1676925 RepID=A0A3B3TCU8_9TELE